MKLYLRLNNVKGIIVLLLLMLALLACKSEKNSIPFTQTSLESKKKIINIKVGQSENYILGDKWLLSKTIDQNDLFSPDIICVIHEFTDSISAIGKMKELLKKDSTVNFLNTNNYHYTDKTGNYILYKKAIPNPNAPKLTTYPKTYRTDGAVEIYRIRLNNFKQDSNLSPTELRNSYGEYNVSILEDSSIMRIEQKKLYTEARPFCRFVKFNSKKEQINALTVNDYSFHSYHRMSENRILLAFSEPLVGARFNYSISSAKLIIVDNDLSVIDELEIFYPGSQLCKVDKLEESYIFEFRFHVNCSSCSLHHCYLEIQLDENLEKQDLRITAYPEEIYVNIDSINHKLKINSQFNPN